MSRALDKTPGYNMTSEYALNSWNVTALTVPETATVLNVGWRVANPVVWMMYDSRETTTAIRRFVAIRQGNAVPTGSVYRGTIITGDLLVNLLLGGLVAHVFELPPA